MALLSLMLIKINNRTTLSTLIQVTEYCSLYVLLTVVVEDSPGPYPQTPAPGHRHQSEQPRLPGHAPGDPPGAAGQCHQDGALAGQTRTTPTGSTLSLFPPLSLSLSVSLSHFLCLSLSVSLTVSFFPFLHLSITTSLLSFCLSYCLPLSLFLLNAQMTPPFQENEK